MLLFSFVGLSLFRFDACRLLELLFHEPPRTPRDELAVAVGRFDKRFHHFQGVVGQPRAEHKALVFREAVDPLY